MKTITYQNASDNLPALINGTIGRNEPILITSEKGNVVLLDERLFRSMKETIYFYSLSSMKEKIIKGIKTRLDDCFEDEISS